MTTSDDPARCVAPHGSPLKERDLRKYATCAHCRRKICETKMPIFYLVTLERHGIDMKAVQRQQGLGMLLGGDGFLAAHMGPDEDMTIPIGGKATVMICEECSTDSLCMHQLAEYAGSDEVSQPEGETKQ